ncbi:MAG: hypothetical protein WC533_00460 [Candidatus Pacearchaeota archaeon]
MAEKEEFSKEIKEQRVRKIALSYYSRKDVLDALYKFSEYREISPRYFEGFGKRPDSFQYPSDILALVKKGATSFHASEELWANPLDLITGIDTEELKKLRTGWDLVIDIDCKWIEYSKKAAQAIIKSLEYMGVKNIGVKFSGNKGFHIIVPSKAFPEKLGDIKTSDMFPEWPRAILGYVTELSSPILADLIKDTASDFSSIKGFTGIKCENCNNISQEKFKVTLRCNNHSSPYIETFNSSTGEYSKKKCPNCNKELKEITREKYYYCSKCSLNSIEHKGNFNETILSTDLYKILGLDVQLVSSRHLFRMPYSLHEKTSLASVVIDKSDLKNFSLKDADPLNIKIKNFIPDSKEGEAGKLLLQAIDWQKSQEKENKITYENKENSKSKKFKPLELGAVREEFFPPAINKILKGMTDGKKRALFILINFFRSINLSAEETEKRINEWNKLNSPQLRQGYVNSQLIWAAKHEIVPPPNFDNEIYKAIGVYETDSLSEKVKNPLTYVSRRINMEKKQKKYSRK